MKNTRAIVASMICAVACLGASSAFAQNSANSDWKGNWGFKTSSDKYYDSAVATEQLQARNGGYGSSVTNSVTNYNGTVNDTSSFNGPVSSTSSGATNIDQQSSTNSTIMGDGVTATVVGKTTQTNSGASQSANSQDLSVAPH